MPDWLIYAGAGAAVVLIMFLAVLIWKKKIVLGSVEISIELGWPPKITFVPKGNSRNVGEKDEIGAKHKSTIGQVKIKGAAPSTKVTAENESKIASVEIERKL